MGNQLTGIAPSQILPIEHYLTDVPDCEFDSSLGSTRFLKVARARSNKEDDYVVVKVFAILDPSLPLKSHKDRLEDIRSRLLSTSNCLPFHKITVSDKAALLFRQYAKDSLYDRMSTRPFLNSIEKKWIAFQLLCALNQAHKLQVCHGDIKSENVMMTSWTWLILTDFASFKPTYLPEDDPADFSYFFDTSRRRTCYIAPERFVESSKNPDTAAGQPNVDLTSSFVKKGDLNPAMDIFSAGCVITELFTEGSAPFDLSQLLLYRCGEYSPWKILEKIEDLNVRELVRHMMQKDPNHRLSAEEYLVQQRGKAFPEYFYTFLKLYLQRFVSTPIMHADDKLTRIAKDLKEILSKMGVKKDNPEENNGLVILTSLVTSSLRSLKFCGTKLVALDVLLQLSKYSTPDLVLDRLIPFMLYFVNDPFPRVRAEALTAITECLSSIKSVTRSDANVFPEYILPSMSHMPQDEAVVVRVTYAKNIAMLAETALRFLEIVQLSNIPGKDDEEEEGSAAHYQASYDAELQALHEMIQKQIVTLLSDQENIVKQTLLMNGITRLCVFFGRQKANDVLLSHMITFLNDKYDWHLRGAFFDSIGGVAAYVGWQSSTILKPLLQQGLTDPEEFVIHKALKTLKGMAELELLQKPLLNELLKDVAAFLCHPGVYVRHGAVGFMSAVAKRSNIADVHCNLLPLLQPFLKHNVIQVEDEVVLLSALSDPLPRAVYEYVLRSTLIERFFACIMNRHIIRTKITRPGHKPVYTEMDDGITQLFRKLASLGMSVEDEDKLLALENIMIKLHRARAGSTESSNNSDMYGSSSNGKINLHDLRQPPKCRYFNLASSLEKQEAVSQQTKSSKKKISEAPTSPTATMNEEWKHMFASSDWEKPPAPPSPKLKAKAEAVEGKSQSEPPETKRDASPKPNVEKQLIRSVSAQCKVELNRLGYRKRNQYSQDVAVRELTEATAWHKKAPPSSWKPKGILAAHLYEHKSAINRIAVSHDQAFFATCSNDGSIRVWESARMMGKNVTNRPRIKKDLNGMIRGLIFLESSHTLASISDNGSIFVHRIEREGEVVKLSLQNQKRLDVDETGLAVDLCHLELGNQSLLTYATVNGMIVGWDLRSPTPAWTLKNDPRHGLITSYDVHTSQSWLAVGTSSGSHICWDMRFQLPITSIAHPTGARVRRLLVNPPDQSSILSAVQGNNEVSLWDMETGSRQRTLWASTAPALSTTQASSHSVNGMWLGTRDNTNFLLTAGSDMRIRYWDLTYPSNSFIIAGAASDPVNRTVVSYKSRLIEGTEVIQETYTKQRGISAEDPPRRSPDMPPAGHRDIITDINVCTSPQCFIITGSRDGVIKVWK